MIPPPTDTATMIELMASGTSWGDIAVATGYADRQTAQRGARNMGLRRIRRDEVIIIEDRFASITINVMAAARSA